MVPTSIAGEHPLTLYLDKREIVTLMTLGHAPEALALGYLRNQRLVGSIEEAAAVMREKKIGCLPVVEKGRLVGILTETDILDAFLESMGVHGPGYRIELVVPDRPEVLFEVVGFFRDFAASIVSLATVSHEDPKRKVLVMRVETKNYKVLKAAIKKGGYEILTAD